MDKHACKFFKFILNKTCCRIHCDQIYNLAQGYLKQLSLFLFDQNSRFNSWTIFAYTQYLMGSTSSPINKVCFQFASFRFNLKLHTSFPHPFRHACSYPIPDVNFTLQDSTTINCLTFSVTIMISFTFRTKTCTTLEKMLSKNYRK